MRDTVTKVVDYNALDHRADKAAVAFSRSYARGLIQVFTALASLDELDDALARANARLPATKRLRPMAARLRACPDPRHGRAAWTSVMANVPVTRRRA